MGSMQFWVAFGSTYSYLTVARIGAAAQQAGVTVDWQPLFLNPLFIEQGRPQGGLGRNISA